MRTKSLGLWLACLLAPTLGFAQKESSNIQLKDGVISIRALADRQRKLEEAEFLNKLNPSSRTAPESAGGGLPGLPTGLPNSSQGGILDASGTPIPPVQELPAIRSTQSSQFAPSQQPSPIQENQRPMPANTVLSVYGQEGKLTAEVAMKNGEIAQYRVGDLWGGYRITDISRDGVSVIKSNNAESTRLIPVGGKL